MVFIPTSQEWLTQSTLLLEARPATTRITTTYSIESARARAARKASRPKTKGDENPAVNTTAPSDAAATAKPPRGKLILKTFDPHSGVCLKYKTTKAAEVGRLIQMLGSAARKMAALPDLPTPAVALEEGDGVGAGTAMLPVPTGGQQQGAGGGGGGDTGKGKKKKKGKK